jgi:cytidine deaminase
MKAMLGSFAVEDLSEGDRELYRRAQDAAQRAYAKYSGFHVGAAVRTGSGAVYSACNVENASYGLTICAERSAIFAAVAAEGPTVRIEELAIHAAAHTVSPCGACRQVLYEFGPTARVVFPKDGAMYITSADVLLPVPFQLEE